MEHSTTITELAAVRWALAPAYFMRSNACRMVLVLVRPFAITVAHSCNGLEQPLSPSPRKRGEGGPRSGTSEGLREYLSEHTKCCT